MFSNRRQVARVMPAIVAMLLLFSMPAVAAFAAVKATSGGDQHVKLAPKTIKGLQVQLEDYLKKDTDLDQVPIWACCQTRQSLGLLVNYY